VLRVWAEPGTLVGPTSTKAILLFADVSQRRVRAFVEELDAHRPCVGQRAVVTVDGRPGKEFSGRVVEVLKRMDADAPRSDAPGEYTDIDYLPVVIQLVNGDELPLNQRVKVRIHVD
jgi:multidrug resistance efflux pump